MILIEQNFLSIPTRRLQFKISDCQATYPEFVYTGEGDLLGIRTVIIFKEPSEEEDDRFKSTGFYVNGGEEGLWVENFICYFIVGNEGCEEVPLYDDPNVPMAQSGACTCSYGGWALHCV